MKYNILITSAGRRVSLVKAFQKELGKLFQGHHVYATDFNPNLSAACNVAYKSFGVSKVNSENYIDELLEICLNNNVGMIIPTIDTELSILSQNKNLFKTYGINIVVSDTEFIDKCRDKFQINDFFIEKNIAIPKPISKFDPTFPIFIKPFDGSLSVDTFLIKSYQELTDAHRLNDRLMFMEYISPNDYDEYTVDMYYNRDSILSCLVPRQRIEIRTGEINKGITRKNKIVDFVKDRLHTIIGARGCLTLQVFLEKEGEKIIGIEINPRFGGGYPLSYLAGANFPKWLIEEYFLENKISFFDEWKSNLLMLRYDAEITIQQ